MLYKFTVVETYFIEAETEEEALDNYSALQRAEVSVELVSPTDK